MLKLFSENSSCASSSSSYGCPFRAPLWSRRCFTTFRVMFMRSVPKEWYSGVRSPTSGSGNAVDVTRTRSMSDETRSEMQRVIKFAKRKQTEYGKLWEHLTALDNMVGMWEAKRAVVRQLKFLIVNRGEKDGHFLNTVLTGNPGTGKTTLLKEIIATSNKKIGRAHV